jgi:hypothetical protein
MRLAYDDLDDAVLDPSTARIVEDALIVNGYVRWDGLCVARARVKGSTRVMVTLHAAPAASFRFDDLERGTGEFVAGALAPTGEGVEIRGVLPGDLVVASGVPIKVWFDSDAIHELAGRIQLIDGAAH